ncbi:MULTISPECIES: helix-turn-helix domain-containing protein [Actinomycetes]|uniref:Helix-turn-helix transcriptional regulator n=3 Tax=Microbispora TaxID=2005 RepID=A0ABY3M311_9ACTN|nr:helix-turn-helix transcriptional regulator [Microbispora fusca]TYB65118.1 helix-turn-helix transcriptional regulator [Microbispora tritici]
MNVVPSLDPASPRVRFGAELRRLREAAQLSQAAVAARLGRTQTQVSRLEKATRTPVEVGRGTAGPALRHARRGLVHAALSAHRRPARRPGLVPQLGRGDRAHRPRPPLLERPPGVPGRIAGRIYDRGASGRATGRRSRGLFRSRESHHRT